LGVANFSIESRNGLRQRALFVCAPATGHFNPLVPIARACADSGHEVAFATTDNFSSVPEQLGFQTFSFGEPGPVPIACLFQPAAIDGLTEVMLDWSADVVVHDHVAAGAVLAGEQARIPNVYVSVGIMRSAEMLASIDNAIRPRWLERGFSPPASAGLYRYLYIDRCPPSLQRHAISEIATAHAIKPESFDEPDGIRIPDWLRASPSKPTVYVTLGTEFNSFDMFSRILTSICNETTVNVIVTIGVNRYPSSFGPQPEHIRIERYIPQSAVMAVADLVICHGGSGAIMGALTAGVPMLLLPQGADQFDNTSCCVERGVARALFAEQVTTDAIQLGVQTLLRDTAYRTAAAEVATEIRQLPNVTTAVPLIERVATTRLPVTNTST
jgi:UDP:flavonoid glycosyltransferase YjiC (YdhE family)